MGEVGQVLEAPAVPVDNIASGANAPGAGERSAPLMARPTWVPEKFFKEGVIDHKGMAESYQELERKQSAVPAVTTPAVVTPPVVEAKPAPVVNTTPVAVPGVAPERVTAFSAEIQKDGKLSAASYTELAALGYTKEVVDVYVGGLTKEAAVTQAVSEAKIAATEIQAIQNEVGGPAKFTEMLTWGKANMSPADQKVYNEAVSSNDPAKVRMAVNGLHQSFVKVHGNTPNYLDLGGNRTPLTPTAAIPFKSDVEASNAMSTRLYKTDQAERDRVAARLAVSDVFQQSRDYSKTER